MKIALFYLTTLVYLGIINETLSASVTDWNQSNSTSITSNQLGINSNFNATDKNDTIKILVKIKGKLKIGWGTKYKCQVLDINTEKLSFTDGAFLMSAATGSEIIYKDIHSLKTNENYYIEFVKSKHKIKEPFIPVGTTGFLGKKGFIWNISKVVEANGINNTLLSDL